MFFSHFSSINEPLLPRIKHYSKSYFISKRRIDPTLRLLPFSKAPFKPSSQRCKWTGSEPFAQGHSSLPIQTDRDPARSSRITFKSSLRTRNFHKICRDIRWRDKCKYFDPKRFMLNDWLKLWRHYALHHASAGFVPEFTGAADVSVFFIHFASKSLIPFPWFMHWPVCFTGSPKTDTLKDTTSAYMNN